MQIVTLGREDLNSIEIILSEEDSTRKIHALAQALRDYAKDWLDFYKDLESYKKTTQTLTPEEKQ